MTIALLTVKDAAAVVGRDVRTVRRWIADGLLATQWDKVWEPDLIKARDVARKRKRAGAVEGESSPRIGRRIEASGDANRNEIAREIAKALVDIDNRESVDMGTISVSTWRDGDAIMIDVGAVIEGVSRNRRAPE